LGRKLGDGAQLFPVLFGMRSFHLVRAELRQARELGEQLLALSETIEDDAGFSLEANLAQGNTLLLLGELIPALESLERAFALYDPRKHRVHAFLYGLDPGAFCLARIAWSSALLGHQDRASKKISEALALAHQQSHAYSMAVTMLNACEIHSLRGDGPASQQYADASVALCTEQGFGSLLEQSKQYRGYALVQQQQSAEGIALMRDGLAAYRTTGAGLLNPYFLAMLADACGLAARFEEGLTAVAEAIAIMERSEEHIYEAKLYRLKGELTLKHFSAPSLQSSIQQQAEACFRKSIEIARRQAAKLFELRATTSLARLLRDTGRRDEACAILADIYHWFTEGFDTADLKDAKKLLDELSA
jgi:predicted ATPase